MLLNIILIIFNYLSDLLSNTVFAGDNVPSVAVETLIVKGKEIDVLRNIIQYRMDTFIPGVVIETLYVSSNNKLEIKDAINKLITAFDEDAVTEE